MQIIQVDGYCQLKGRPGCENNESTHTTYTNIKEQRQRNTNDQQSEPHNINYTNARSTVV